jgi:hypothetical protein
MSMLAGTLSGESYFSLGGVIDGGYSALNAILPMDRSSVALLCNVINPEGLAAFLGASNGIRPAMLGSGQ